MYFLSVPTLEKLGPLNGSGDVRIDIVTKAKKSCTAFQNPGPRKPGKGRLPKKGAAIHLKGLPTSHAGQFQETETGIYGKKETIRYYCIDLLWGQKLYQELRFVLVEMGGSQNILASTSLELTPLSIFRLYSHWFRIECTFQELKQQTGAFCCHSWSKYMQKISYYQKKGEPAPIERMKGGKPRKKVLEAVRTIEMHMALSCIAMGILQCLSIRYIGKASSATKGHRPAEGFPKQPLCTIFGNIFSAF